MLSGYKTVLFGALLAVAGFLQGVNWVEVIPDNPATVGWVTTAIGAVVVVLRMLTNTPIGK